MNICINVYVCVVMNEFISIWVNLCKRVVNVCEYVNEMCLSV